MFLGRSNVGKSSLINKLLGARGLARTSSQPGRTQSVNFYRVNEAFWFVDLPGYGYAQVPESIRRTWRPMIEGFLARHEDRIAMGVLVVDARRGATDLDLTMRDWLEERRLAYVVAATKSDKLSGNARSAAERAVREGLGSGAGLCGTPILVSGASGAGVKEMWKRLDAVLPASG